MENEEQTGGVTAQGGGIKAGTKAGTKAEKKFKSDLTDEEIAKRKTEMPWIEEMQHWKCNFCGHIMTSNTAWNKHSRKNCLEVEPQNPGWYLGWDRKNSRCRYCLQIFVRRRNIRKHLQKRLCPNMPEYNTRHPEVQGLPGNIQNQQKKKQVFVQRKKGKKKAGDFKPSSGLCFGDGCSFIGVPSEGARMLTGTYAEDSQPGTSGQSWNPYPSSSVGGHVGSAVSSSGSYSTGVHIPAGGPAGSLLSSGAGHFGDSHPSTGYQFVSPYPSTGCGTGDPRPSFYGPQQRDTQQAFVPGQHGFPVRLQDDTNITGSHTDPSTLPTQGGQFNRLQRPLQMKSHEELSGGFQEGLFSGPMDRLDRQPARDQEWTTANVHSLQRCGGPHRDDTSSVLPDSTTDGIQADGPDTLSEQTGRHSWQLWSFKHREESNRLWSDKTLQQKSSTHDPAGSMGSGFLSIFDKQPQHTTSECGRESPPIEINLLERPWSNKAGLQQLSEEDQKSRFGKSQADSLQSLCQDNTSQQAPCGDQQEQFPGQRDSQQRSAMETGFHGGPSSGPFNNRKGTRDREVNTERQRSSIHIHRRQSSSLAHKTRGSIPVVGRKLSQSPLHNKGRSSSPHFHRRHSHSPDHQRPGLHYSAKHGQSPQHQAIRASSPRRRSPQDHRRRCSPGLFRRHSLSPLSERRRGGSPEFSTRLSLQTERDRSPRKLPHKTDRDENVRILGPPHSDRDRSPRMHPFHTDRDRSPRMHPSHDRDRSPRMHPSHDRDRSPRMHPSHDRDRSPRMHPSHTDRDRSPRMHPSHTDRDRSPRMHPSHTDEDRSSRTHLHSYHRDGSPSRLSHNSNWEGSPRMLYHNDNTDRGVDLKTYCDSSSGVLSQYCDKDQSPQMLSHRVDREESPVGLHHHSHRDKSLRIRPGHREGQRSSRMLSGHSERDRGAKMPSHRGCREGSSEMHSYHSHREGNPKMHSHHSQREGNREMLSHHSLREKSPKVPPSFSERHQNPRMHPSHRERSPRMHQSHSGRERSPRLPPEREQSPRMHTSQSERERSAHMHLIQIDRSLQMRPSHSERERSPRKLSSHSERGRSPGMRQSPGPRERSARMLSSRSERERSPRLSHGHRERNPRMRPSHSDRDKSPRLFSGHYEKEGSPRMFSGYCEREESPQTFLGHSERDGSPQMYWDHSEREASPRMFSDHPERERSPRILHGYDKREGSPRVLSHFDECRSSKACPGRVSHQGKRSDRRSHERHHHQHSSRQYSGSPSGSGISRGRAGRQEERHVHSSPGRQFDTSSHRDQDRNGFLDRHRAMDEGSGWEDRSPQGSRRLSPDHGGRHISPRWNSPSDLRRSSPSQLPWREESPRHDVWTEGHTRRHSPDRSSQRFSRESPDHGGRRINPRQNSPFDKRRSSPGLLCHRGDDLGRHSAWRESHARKRSPDNRSKRCSNPSEQRRRRESSPFVQRQRELSPFEHRRRELGSEMSGQRRSRSRTREHRHSHGRSGRSSPEGHRRSRSPLYERRYEDSSDRHDSFRHSERESFAASRSKRSGYRT